MATRTSNLSLFANDLFTSGLAYPSGDGNPGQVIQTDGNGTLTFADQRGTIDSAGTTSLIISTADSAYVAARSPAAQKTFFRFSADSGQTVFVGNDLSGDTLAYNPDNVSVYINGVLLADSDDYYTNSGTTITLYTGADSGDDVFVTSFQTLNIGGKPPAVSVSQFLYTADSGQVTFTNGDSSGAVLNYTPNNLLVHMNGLLLKQGEDFTATDGTSVVLTDGANLGDELVFTSLQQSLFGAWREVNTGYSLSKYERVIVNTSNGAISLTLPSTPNFGDEIQIVDGTGNAGTNNITINRNGNKILGTDSDLTIDVNRASVTMVYYNASQGWILTEQ